MTPSETDPDAIAAHRLEDLETCRQAMLVVIEEGVRMARVICQRTQDDVEWEGSTARGMSAFASGLEAATAYERTARTVRRCVLLLQKVGDPGWWEKAAPTPRAAHPVGKMVRAGYGIIMDEADPEEFLTQDVRTDSIDRLDREVRDADMVTPETLGATIAGMQSELGKIRRKLGEDEDAPPPDDEGGGGDDEADDGSDGEAPWRGGGRPGQRAAPDRWGADPPD